MVVGVDMQIDIGRYTLDMDYDPREQDNASDKRPKKQKSGLKKLDRIEKSYDCPINDKERKKTNWQKD